MAEKLVHEVFFCFSAPEQLHSDQGRQFESQLVSEVCKLLHVHKTRTTLYHPQSDGNVKRFNRTMLSMLATCTQDNPLDWENHIRKVCMTYNSSVQASTGYTPFFLMFGRQARIPVDVMFGSPNSSTQTIHEYAAKNKWTGNLIWQENTLSQTTLDKKIMIEKFTGSHTTMETLYGYTLQLVVGEPAKSCVIHGLVHTRMLRNCQIATTELKSCKEEGIGR